MSSTSTRTVTPRSAARRSCSAASVPTLSVLQMKYCTSMLLLRMLRQPCSTDQGLFATLKNVGASRFRHLFDAGSATIGNPVRQRLRVTSSVHHEKQSATGCCAGRSTLLCGFGSIRHEIFSPTQHAESTVSQVSRAGYSAQYRQVMKRL